MSVARKLTLAKEENVLLMGRVGYAARAVVYGLVGIYALLLIFREGGGLTDTRGIFLDLLGKPFGKIILIVMAMGLFSFAMWRLLQAVRDYESHGNGAKGIAIRVGYGFSALAYTALGYHAINLIFHLSRQSKRSGESEVAHTLLSQSFGALAMGALALIIAGIGIGQIYIAVKEKFTKHLSLPHGSEKLCAICKAGIIARGIVFCIIGWLFMRAALHSNSSEVDGMRGAWKFLAAQPFGSALVGAMALGLLAFSLYGFTEAVYRRDTGIGSSR